MTMASRANCISDFSDVTVAYAPGISHGHAFAAGLLLYPPIVSVVQLAKSKWPGQKGVQGTG
jgi:hypothetical protein